LVFNTFGNSGEELHSFEIENTFPLHQQARTRRATRVCSLVCHTQSEKQGDEFLAIRPSNFLESFIQLRSVEMPPSSKYIHVSRQLG
jgi:hypothetical protein